MPEPDKQLAPVSGRPVLRQSDAQPPELCDWDAHALASAIRERRISAAEVMDAHLSRIDALNGRLNALVSLVPRDEALAAAAAADRAIARGDDVGPLHGLPIAIKDLSDVAGIRTTYGSRLFSDHVPVVDHPIVSRLREAGALIIAKTNSPEFGAGTLTYNSIFGPTANPYDLSRNAGGSSGGAGAAVAAGLLPFADGSDSGGSIRVPASFCNLIGLRPTPGRVPFPRDGWSPHGVIGPIARSVRDAGLLLGAMSGCDPYAPLSLPADGSPLIPIEPAGMRSVRVAFSRSAGGLPIEADVSAALDRARAAFLDAGCKVEDVEPDFSGADECWETIELFWFAGQLGEVVDTNPSVVRSDVVRNIELGRSLTAAQLSRAIRTRTEIYQRTVDLLTRFDILALPAAPVPPPALEDEHVAVVAGTEMGRYYTWQRCSTRVTVTAHPAVSVPAGFTHDDLPVGIQLVGRYGDDFGLLRLAAGFEAATGYGRRRAML